MIAKITQFWQSLIHWYRHMIKTNKQQVSNIPPAPKQKKVKQIKTQEELDFWILVPLAYNVFSFRRIS